MAARASHRSQAEVRERILVAATELFGTLLPRDVTVRDIAERAGVQHSLVHRHFTTKDRLLAEVVARAIAGYAETVARADDPAEAFVDGMRHIAQQPAGFLALAGARIGREQPEHAQQTFPGADLHRKKLQDAGVDGAVDAGVVTVAAMAFAAGWALFEDWWIAAAGVDDRDVARAQVTDILRRLVRREAGLEADTA
jgi:AcrR family transcriptional regulator